MKFDLSRALVPLRSWLPSRRPREVEVLPPHPGTGAWESTIAPPEDGKFGLVRQETYLRDTDQVKRYLPDILGRALARIWIDPFFRDRFAADPIGTMAEYNVFLPRGIQVEFETEGVTRPRIVVYEARPQGQRRRLLYLQLVMKAGT
jgi:hypothetical protein